MTIEKIKELIEKYEMTKKEFHDFLDSSLFEFINDERYPLIRVDKMIKSKEMLGLINTYNTMMAEKISDVYNAITLYNEELADELKIKESEEENENIYNFRYPFSS